MNILMVAERYIPIWGGAENQLRQLIPRLSQRGCSISIVTRRWHTTMSPVECIDNTRVVRLGIPGNGNLATLLFIMALILFVVRNRKNIDILHSHGAVNMGALCRVLAFFLNKKNITKIASAGKISHLRNNPVGQISLFLFKQSDAIISMTEEIDQELAGIGAAAEKVKRLVNGVDGDRFRPCAIEERKEVRACLGLAADIPMVLFSSRLVTNKGLKVLIDAWPSILERHRKAWLIIIGSGADQKNSIEEEVKRKVAHSNLPNVSFLGEKLSPEMYLGAADIFVFPSRREGFPNALMEALASEVPVVASNIGGVRGMLVGDGMGVLFESGNPRDLAEKVIKLLDNKKWARDLARNGRKQMIDKYSFDRIASQYYSLYEEVSGC